MLANWKTTSAAVAALPLSLGAALTLSGVSLTNQFDGDPTTLTAWTEVSIAWGVFFAAIGNLFSQDIAKSESR